MLIECIGNPIKADGEEVLKDLRLNLAPNHQMRIKVKYLFEESEVPVDIVIFNYSSPRLDKLSLSISIDGKEMTHKINFRVNLAYSFMTHKWTLKGTVGGNPVKKELSTFLEIFQVIKELIEPYHFTDTK